MTSTSLFDYELEPALTFPYPFQTEAVEAIEREIWELKRKSTLVVIPTGGGKTHVAGHAIRRFVQRTRKKTLFLAHRDELISQAAEKFASLGLYPVIEKAEQKARHAPGNPHVVVGSVATMQGRRLKQWPRDHFGQVFVDEAHRATCEGHMNILRHFKAPVIGVTATAHRSDDTNLGLVFESKAFEYTILQAITAPHPGPYLVEPVYRQIEEEIDLSSMRIVGADDYSDEDLREILRPHIKAIANEVKNHIEDRSCLVFTPGVIAATAMASALQSLGLRAQASWGDDPDRRFKVKGFRSGDIQILCGCDVFTEGFDVPRVSMLVMARPTKSWTLLTQMVGRGLRLWPPRKSDCIAEGQRVLTDQGLVPIEAVTTDMKVWDGIEFVNHDGAICRGEQEVIEYDGLAATPDHEVWTSDGWRKFGECQKEKRRIAVTGDGRTPIREADGYFGRDSRPQQKQQADDSCSMQRMPRGGAEGISQRQEKSSRMQKVRKPNQCAEMALCEMRSRQAEMPKHEMYIVRKVWRQRDRIPVRKPIRDGDLGQRKSWDKSKTGDRQDRQLGPLRTRKSSPFDETREPEQYQKETLHASNACVPNEASRGKLLGRDPVEIVQPGFDGGSDIGTIPETVRKTKRRVWDILNAGPLHRFTVEGFLVSNCVILDFAWKCLGNHKPLRVANLIAGDCRLTWEEEQEIGDEAHKLLETKAETSILKAVERAKANVGEKTKVRRTLDLKVEERQRKAAYSDFDPFKAQKVQGEPRAYQPEFKPRPASEKQIETLRGAGIPVPDTISAGRASSMIDMMMKRRDAGLCTLKQKGVLVDRVGMSAEQADRTTFEEAIRLISDSMKEAS